VTLFYERKCSQSYLPPPSSKSVIAPPKRDLSQNERFQASAKMFKGQVPPSANTTSQESKKYNQPRNSNNQKHKRKSTHRHHSESEASKKANSFRRYVEYFESSEIHKSSGEFFIYSKIPLKPLQTLRVAALDCCLQNKIAIRIDPN